MIRWVALFALAAWAGEPVEIPAGSFQQGDASAPDARWLRTVELSAYAIDRAEVSVSDFERFVAQGWSGDQHWSAQGLAWRAEHPEGAGAELRRSGRGSDHPVVAVSWFEAEAYCAWAGGRLPTEAEWERASCAGDGARFPWGDDEPEGPVWFTGGKRHAVQGVDTQSAERQDAAFASPAGLIHAAGNVWEWTADGYHAQAYDTGPARDPRHPHDTPWRVLRGGSYMNLPSYCSCRHREPARPEQQRLTAGFRCAYDR